MGCNSSSYGNKEILCGSRNELQCRNTAHFPRHYSFHSEFSTSNDKLFPYLPWNVLTQIRSFLQPPMEGVVLQTYGAGNVPDIDANAYLFQELKDACERGVVVVNCTQCSSGVVTDLYAGGIVSRRVCVCGIYCGICFVQKLRQAGVVSGVDMTAEAALTKLSFLLARKYNSDRIRELVQQNLHGELTTLHSSQLRFSLKDSVFLRTVAEALNVSSSKVHSGMCRNL